MTKKTLLAARRATDAAKRAKVKLDSLAALQNGELAAKLADAARDAKEAEEAAAEAEAEAQRQLLAKADLTFWERFKKWFS